MNGIFIVKAAKDLIIFHQLQIGLIKRVVGFHGKSGWATKSKESIEIQKKMWLAIRDKLMARISEEMSKHR